MKNKTETLFLLKIPFMSNLSKIFDLGKKLKLNKVLGNTFLQFQPDFRVHFLMH